MLLVFFQLKKGNEGKRRFQKNKEFLAVSCVGLMRIFDSQNYLF